MDYEKILNDLINHEITEYEVQPNEAFDFQNALRNFEKRKEIVGTAKRNGIVVYSAL